MGMIQIATCNNISRAQNTIVPRIDRLLIYAVDHITRNRAILITYKLIEYYEERIVPKKRERNAWKI